MTPWLVVLFMAARERALPRLERLCARRPRRHLFFEVGSNRGDVLRAFYSGKIPKFSVNPHWTFPVSGYNASEWEVFAFEASPTHRVALEALEAAHPLLHISIAAAWSDANSSIRLSIDDTKTGMRRAQWGSSVVRDWGQMGGSSKTVDVPTVDFASFVARTVCPQDHVVVKMNIEGAEFAVVPHLIDKGLLCLIDDLDFYWHPNFVSLGDYPDPHALIAATDRQIKSCGRMRCIRGACTHALCSCRSVSRGVPARR